MRMFLKEVKELTIRESLVFKYDGFYSSNFGLYNISIDGDGGMFEENFLPPTSINEVSVRGRDKPYFQFAEREPLEFSVSFIFKDTFNNQLINKIVRWLASAYYKRLIFSSAPTRVYYAMPIDDARIIHNGLKQGYVNLSFRCNAPYAFGDVRQSRKYIIENNEKKRY